MKQPEGQTEGTVIAVKKQWWLKVNTKPIRRHSTDGARFPHILTVSYRVNGREYRKHKWLSPGHPVPPVGTTLRVTYPGDRPEKGRAE